MIRGSPAFTKFVPDAIAHPSTPKDPIYFLDHGPGGDGDGVLRFRGLSGRTAYRLTKLFKVGVAGFSDGDVVISPSGGASRS